MTTSKINCVAMVMGTRPEIIKMAPVVHALERRKVDVRVIHSGQHQDMAWPLYDFFGISPQHKISLQRNQPGLGGLSSELMGLINLELESMRPDLVLVHGDTSSAAMGALAASMAQVPVGHVEAGLRSGSLTEPFPEEINRSLIARVAKWHFAPTGAAAQNLQREGVPGELHVVGNTVVDAVLMAAERVKARSVKPAPLDALKQQGLSNVVLVTAHRRENWGQPMQDIAQAAQRLLRRHPELGIIWPLHPNPDIQRIVRAVHAASPESERMRWQLCEPLEYPDMVAVMAASSILLTDSGGIQEEGLSLGKPILVMRDVTERPEVIASGWGQLVGTRTDRIVQAVEDWFSNPTQGGRRLSGNPFGSGVAGEKIAEILTTAESGNAEIKSSKLMMDVRT